MTERYVPFPWRTGAAIVVILAVVRTSGAAAVTVRLKPVANTYVSQDEAGVNFATSPELQIARTVEFHTVRRSYVRFDLSAVPPTAIISSAELRLYLRSASGAAISVSIYPALASWTAKALTWNNQPAVGSARASTAVGTLPGYQSWVLTKLVQTWVAGDLANDGVSVRGPESSGEWSRTFDSSRGTSDPELVITYDLPAPTATRTATATARATSTPTASVTRTPTASPPATFSRTPTQTATLTHTAAATATRPPTATPTSSPTLTQVATPTATSTPPPTSTRTATATLTTTPTPTPTISATMPPSRTATPTRTATPDAQVEALRRLRTDSRLFPALRVVRGIVRSVGVGVPVPGGLPDDPVLQALDFLERYRDLYRLTSPRSQLYLKRIFKNRTGEHVFFGQHENGTPIHAAELAVHLRGGVVTHTSGNYLAEMPQLGAPTTSARAAQAIAAAAVPGTRVKPIGEARLTYYNAGLGSRRPAATHLAWRVHLSGMTAAEGIGTTWTYFVDAHGGGALRGVDDSPRAFDLSLKNAEHESGESNECLASRDDLAEWFTEAGATDDYPGGDADAEAARSAARATYDFFAGLDRDSYNGRGDTIPVLVHVGRNWPNALWKGACNEMRIGDEMAATDVFAHEFTHGVRQSSPNAAFDLDLDETFSLSESYSDVFGCLVESAGAAAVDWVIGEDTRLGAVGDLSDPPRFGWVDHYDDYEGDNVEFNEEHNSGIPSKAAFLITDGGTHHGFVITGLGPEVVKHLYFDTLMALTSNAALPDAATESVHTALDYAAIGFQGFGDFQVCMVRNAFAAVGLGHSFDRDCDGVRDADDPDADGDGVDVTGQGPCTGGETESCDDNCPLLENPGQQDCDDDGIGDACDDFNLMPLCLDSDRDGILDRFDNCPCNDNPDQLDYDADWESHICQLGSEDGAAGGDACDSDDDNDGVADEPDNCPWQSNPDQADGDRDGVGDKCDNCEALPNANQADNDHDGIGDVCDPDDDDDGVCDRGGPDPADLACRGLKPPAGAAPNACCPGAGGSDVCPLVFDPQQIDVDRNGLGLGCDTDEAEMLSGNWAAGVDLPIRFGDAADAFLVPIAPCSDLGCPDWLEPDYVTGVDVSLPFRALVNIVDDRGFLVARGSRGASQTLEFQPAADTFFRASGGRTVVGRAAADDEAYRGTHYSLAISPPTGVEVGRDYPATITVRSWRRPACVGDCGGDAEVAVDELLRLVNIALGHLAVTECPAGDNNGDRTITVDEILSAVNNALRGCAA